MGRGLGEGGDLEFDGGGGQGPEVGRESWVQGGGCLSA